MTGFATGFQDRRDSQLRRRGELAQAFGQFRQQNPNATYQEYQDYVDSLSGGDNYLRGGLPSQQVLQSMAERNETRQNEERVRQQMVDDAARFDFDTQFETNADRHIANADTDDPDTLYSSFSERFPNIDLSQYGGSSRFTARNISRVRSRQVEEYMDRAVGLITDTNGQITSQTLEQEYGVPRNISEPLLRAAQLRANEARAERERGRAATENVQNTALASTLWTQIREARADGLVQMHIQNGRIDDAVEMMVQDLAPFANAWETVRGVPLDSPQGRAILSGDLTNRARAGQTVQTYEHGAAREAAIADNTPQLLEELTRASVSAAPEGGDEREAIARIVAGTYQYDEGIGQAVNDTIDRLDGAGFIRRGDRQGLTQAVLNDPTFLAAVAGRELSTIAGMRANAMALQSAPLLPMASPDVVAEITEESENLQTQVNARILAAQKHMTPEGTPDIARQTAELNRLADYVDLWEQTNVTQWARRATDPSSNTVGTTFDGDAIRSQISGANSALHRTRERIRQGRETLSHYVPDNTVAPADAIPSFDQRNANLDAARDQRIQRNRALGSLGSAAREHVRTTERSRDERINRTAPWDVMEMRSTNMDQRERADLINAARRDAEAMVRSLLENETMGQEEKRRAIQRVTTAFESDPVAFARTVQNDPQAYQHVGASEQAQPGPTPTPK